MREVELDISIPKPFEELLDPLLLFGRKVPPAVMVVVVAAVASEVVLYERAQEGCVLRLNLVEHCAESPCRVYHLQLLEVWAGGVLP